jgi:hypothetical protein
MDLLEKHGLFGTYFGGSNQLFIFDADLSADLLLFW